MIYNSIIHSANLNTYMYYIMRCTCSMFMYVHFSRSTHVQSYTVIHIWNYWSGCVNCEVWLSIILLWVFIYILWTTESTLIFGKRTKHFCELTWTLNVNIEALFIYSSVLMCDVFLEHVGQENLIFWSPFESSKFAVCFFPILSGSLFVN